MIRVKFILCSVAILLLTNCKNQKDTPKVIYEDAKKTMVQPDKMDSSDLEISDLPIQFKGTDFLIFPIGKLHIYSRNNKSSFDSSSSENELSCKISNKNGASIKAISFITTLHT